jgi:hypothetical protein
MIRIHVAGVVLAMSVTPSVPAAAQSMLTDVMARHGVLAPGGNFERAFDAGMTPSIPVTPGSFATPLAVMSAATGRDRIAAAYAFGILAGRAGRAASPPELMAAGQLLVQMIGDADRRTRIAGARVAGRVFTVPFDATTAAPLPPGLIDALFTSLNRDSDVDQLAAMDALGLTRAVVAVSSLTERYYFYRQDGKRALAGGALEALVRIGDGSTVEVVKLLAGDKWSDGHDATALVVAFARERMLRDGSVAVIRQAVDDSSRRVQALGYLAELGVAAP